jgi:ubiquinone/menaquinone biosynthesis C-methylase UbiE
MSTPVAPAESSPSHRWGREKFDVPSRAASYPSEYSSRKRRDRREKVCVLECLKAIPTGGHVLDLPCGTGRMTRILVERGYRVTAADAAEAMLAKARETYATYRQQRGGLAPKVPFHLRDILSTGYADDEFDGVTCIRLFHHFYESAVRRRALIELRRICRGPIVVTFRNSFALDYLWYWANARLRRSRQLHMLPIPMTTFAAEIDAAGLQIDKRIAVRWGISSRWFLVLRRRPSGAALRSTAA